MRLHLVGADAPASTGPRYDEGRGDLAQVGGQVRSGGILAEVLQVRAIERTPGPAGNGWAYERGRDLVVTYTTEVPWANATDPGADAYRDVTALRVEELWYAAACTVVSRRLSVSPSATG